MDNVTIAKTARVVSFDRMMGHTGLTFWYCA